MFQQHLERLAAWATGPEREPEVLRAKADFWRLTGEAHEDDRSFEARMAAFLEHYLLDRPLEDGSGTPIAAFLAAHRDSLPAEERAIFEGLGRTIHAVFEVRKLGTRSGLRVRELFSGTDHEIFERRGMPGVEKGDLLHGRLVPLDGRTWFSGTFLYHPRDARKPILKEVKRRVKADPLASAQSFAWELARLLLKLERYRNVSVENIYRFG